MSETEAAPVETPEAPTAPSKRKRTYTRHGLTAPKAALALRGMDALDKRTAAARTILAFRANLEADLGGEAALSVQQRKLVDLVARDHALLDHFDVYLFSRKTLLGKTARALVRERGAIVDRIARTLAALGLKRAAREVSLGDYLKARSAAPSPRPDVAPVEVKAEVVAESGVSQEGKGAA